MFYELTNEYETTVSPDRPIYVLWSGGMDSTALLYALAKTFSTRKNPIYAISILADCVVSGQKERWFRKQQKKIFKKEKLNIKYINIEIKNAYGNYNRENARMPMLQPLLWLSSLVQLLKYNNNAQILFAYVREDDIWHRIAEFKRIFSTFKLFAYNDRLELKFPLEWVRKQEVIKFLEKHNLLRYVTFCEEESYKPCGACPSCKRVLNLL